MSNKTVVDLLVSCPGNKLKQITRGLVVDMGLVLAVQNIVASSACPFNQ